MNKELRPARENPPPFLLIKKPRKNLIINRRAQNIIKHKVLISYTIMCHGRMQIMFFFARKYKGVSKLQNV